MTPDTLMLAGLGLGLINAVLLLVLLLRRPRFDTPADLAARIGVMEQALQGLAQAGARAGRDCSHAQGAAALFRPQRAAGPLRPLTKRWRGPGVPCVPLHPLAALPPEHAPTPATSTRKSP